MKTDYNGAIAELQAIVEMQSQQLTFLSRANVAHAEALLDTRRKLARLDYECLSQRTIIDRLLKASMSPIKLETEGEGYDGQD